MATHGQMPRRPRGQAPAALAALLAGAAAISLAACTAPPPEAYASSGAVVAGEPAGTDARGEACTAQAGRAPALDHPLLRAEEVYCGGWTQPAARVFALRAPASQAELDQLAAGGVWRRWLEERLVCGAPQPTTLAGGASARLLSCTRRAGGWPHLALVAAGPEGAVVADGMPSALPVIERLVAGQTGAAAPAAAGTARSEAQRLAVARLSAQAFGSGDVGQYDSLIRLGSELNLAENYAAAEDAYRAALAIQERILGASSPDTAFAVMHLALNLSNQHRFQEAEALFRRADALAPRASDPLAPARLLYYRGLHAKLQGRMAEAVELFGRAEAAYAALLPPALLRPGAEGLGFAVSTPVTQAAFIELAETRRNHASVLAREGATEEARALLAESRGLLRRLEGQHGLIAGRALRTEAFVIGRGAGGNPERVARMLLQAAQRFRQAAPGERPEAMTLFLAGQRWAEAGRIEAALGAFRAGADILRARQIALTPDQVLAYLDVLAARREGAAPADAAALEKEMFAAAQLAQRGQTVRFVSQAAARLASAGSDSRVAEAVRSLQDLDRELRELFAERDAASSRGASETAAALDARITERQAARAEAEAAVAAAAPGYRQLLLASADAESVARALAPKEVLVHTLLGAEHGYVLAVAATGRVMARRVELGEAGAAALVARIRAGFGQAGGVREFDTAAAHELYTRLLGPVAPALAEAEALVIVPDGPLLALPFGMLLTEPARPDALREASWLLRRHAIAHTPSPQALVTIRSGAPASAAPQPYIGFGDFVPPSAAQLARSFPADRCAQDARLAAGLARLPGTREEVRFAARFLGAGEGAMHFGQDFTAAALRAAGLSQQRVIHLATHALLPGELSCMPEPAIVLSPQRGAADASSAFLRASEILAFKLDADLVILSACNTAGPATGVQNGSANAGEALSGLARSFFFAGARGLLVTHWEAVDRAAAITVADMMRRQQEGADSAAALRGAQLLLLEEAGRSLPAAFAHPYYWAGFALIGDGRRSPAERQHLAGEASGGQRPL